MTGQEEIKIWFGRNVEKNLGDLYGVAMRLTHKQSDAEDLVAESVAKAWSAIDTLEDRGRFRPWIFRILHNCFISECRKRSIRPIETPYLEQEAGEQGSEITSLLLDQPNEFLNWWANPEQEFFHNLLGDQIRSAIEKLPKAFRITVLLINVEGLGYDEAAVVLGIPKGTVRSRMKRARTLLQKALWELAEESDLGKTATRSER